MTESVAVGRAWKDRPWILAAFIVLPWLIASAPLWQFSKDTFIVPLSSDLFDLSFAALANQRIVLSPWLIHPLLIGYSAIGPALLVVIFFLARRILSELPWGPYLALGLALYLYPLGAPGTTPYELLELTFLGICLNPLLVPAKPLSLWILAAIGLGLATLTQQNEFIIFWITFSLSMGYLIHYILALKTALPKRMRDRFLVTSLSAFGLTCLAISVLYLSLNGAIARGLIHTTPNSWWVAWILGILSVALCWLKPWETHRWLCLAIFGHGIFFSAEMETPIWIASSWLLFQILTCLPSDFWKQKLKFQKINSKIKAIGSILCFFAIAGFQIHGFHAIRDFRSGWVSVAKELSLTPGDGVLVIGQGTSFLAHFSGAKFVESSAALTIETEKDLLQQLTDEGLNQILVDTRFTNDFWKRWIKEGGELETSNRSIITRLITDGGKEIKLRTIRLNAISNFKSHQLKSTDFVLIQPTKVE